MGGEGFILQDRRCSQPSLRKDGDSPELGEGVEKVPLLPWQLLWGPRFHNCPPPPPPPDSGNINGPKTRKLRQGWWLGWTQGRRVESSVKVGSNLKTYIPRNGPLDLQLRGDVGGGRGQGFSRERGRRPPQDSGSSCDS